MPTSPGSRRTRGSEGPARERSAARVWRTRRLASEASEAHDRGAAGDRRVEAVGARAREGPTEAAAPMVLVTVLRAPRPQRTGVLPERMLARRATRAENLVGRTPRHERRTVGKQLANRDLEPARPPRSRLRGDAGKRGLLCDRDEVLLHRLEGADRPPELTPFARVGNGDLIYAIEGAGHQRDARQGAPHQQLLGLNVLTCPGDGAIEDQRVTWLAGEVDVRLHGDRRALDCHDAAVEEECDLLRIARPRHPVRGPADVAIAQLHLVPGAPRCNSDLTRFHGQSGAP